MSKLIILHEEGEDGNSMPNLEIPVQAVSKAVSNLVRLVLASSEIGIIVLILFILNALNLISNVGTFKHSIMIITGYRRVKLN